MTTFLAGGTGTPKLLAGARRVFDPAETTVVGNTGDDVALGGLLVCPDLDTVLFEGGGVLDRETWWGIADDGSTTHDYLTDLAAAADIDPDTPRYLPDDAQTAGRDIARWRRFSAASEFMFIGDRDRAVHTLRAGLLDEGHTLTEVTRRLADAFDLSVDLVPMSNDPVATIVQTPDGEQHFQTFWVAEHGDPTVEDVEFRGGERATAAQPAIEAIRDGPVVVGPSNPVTSIGPMLALDGIADALRDAQVVAVSPFVEDEVFSGPAAKLMAAVGHDPSTAGVADAYDFADAFVLDTADSTDLDRPVVRTDTSLDTEADAERVARACRDALVAASGEVA
ncbi:MULTISPECIES: 2-phospho-L-lactate transferase [Halobacterium]|uniref:2-phospho-L-lactate transferase n=1 Tax=Halobacterium TaxID=2239 RepID=UPI001964D132|nr:MULTISPECIES: 2-phospho-L-lactate transferase [Halobacterium]MCF2165253.1 2-phospho-L-lactate transferase [Halobacterium salinarum]MCF2167938.1 2-phospho-L-lactate transferase [Halobacterium salinarum]MCF2208414.1 2-phospho-L-lactate transferase [Halobacterium salinarum]MCF2238740.1 2-phospho-L-lactate transferase [Halobacterium salinarum]QRY21804.1 2-phospho-L-lactate transferase [Halobacterium sp. GSL-19]